MAWYRCGGTPSEVLSLPTPSEASGAIARFNTDLTENLLSAVAEFSASQASGTPTPANPIPIFGVDKVNFALCGLNLWDEEWESGTYSTADGRPSVSANAIRSKNIIAIKPSSTFAFFNSTANAQIRLYYYDKSGAFLSWEAKTAVNNVVTFTTPENACFINFAVGNSVTPVTTNNQNLSINYPSTDTEYHAYNGTTALINLGGTYYEGEVDAVTGKITLTHKAFDLGDLVYTYNATKKWFSISGFATSENLKLPISASVATDGICEIYKAETQNNLTNDLTIDNSFGLFSSGALVIRDLAYTDGTQFATARSGKKIVFELATPLVVYASNTAEIPTIVGDNQVFCDSGNIAVKFFETVGHKI